MKKRKLYIFLAITIFILSPVLRLFFFNGLLGFPSDEIAAMEMVKEHNNGKYCGRITSFKPNIFPGTTQQDDRDNCYNRAANHLKDVKWCNKIQNLWYRGMCQSGRIPCAEIENDSARYTCFFDQAKFGKISLEECKAAEGLTEQAFCFEGMGQRTLDTKYCDLISNNSSIGGSKRLCYQHIAIMKMDKKICESITQEEYVGYCKIDVDEEIRRQKEAK